MVNVTASEAEVLLGRSLTGAEKIWVQLTYGLQDYHLYCLTVFLLAAFFCIACLPYAVIDYLRLPFFEKYKIQQGTHVPLSNSWACFKSVMFVMATTILPLQILSYPFFKLAGITGDLPLPSVTDIILQLTVFFLIEDYGNYWLHRLMHNGWLYENIHYKHHEFVTPISVSSTYAHWAEVLVLGIPSFVGPAIVQCHVITLWLWILLRQWEAIDTHSGYDFPWSITKLIPFYGGPEYHDYHHFIGGKSQGNFASVFTYCDSLYGTDKGFRVMKSIKSKIN